jgi:hypothetical protein
VGLACLRLPAGTLGIPSAPEDLMSDLNHDDSCSYRSGNGDGVNDADLVRI